MHITVLAKIEKFLITRTKNMFFTKCVQIYIIKIKYFYNIIFN
jgi:hypothetical protein